jgi:hypothetical protein
MQGGLGERAAFGTGWGEGEGGGIARRIRTAEHPMQNRRHPVLCAVRTTRVYARGEEQDAGSLCENVIVHLKETTIAKKKKKKLYTRGVSLVVFLTFRSFATHVCLHIYI